MAISRVQAIIPAGGFLDGTALTTSYQTLLDCRSSRVAILIIQNTCNQLIDISLDGGVTLWATIPLASSSRGPLIINFAANGLDYSGIIQVKETSTKVTTGSISAAIIRSN